MFYNIKIKSKNGEYSLESTDKDIIQREMDLYFASMYGASEDFRAKIKKIEIRPNNPKSLEDIEQLKTVREEVIKTTTQTESATIKSQEIQITEPKPINTNDITSREVQLTSLQGIQLEKFQEVAPEIKINPDSTPIIKDRLFREEDEIKPALKPFIENKNTQGISFAETKEVTEELNIIKEDPKNIDSEPAFQTISQPIPEPVFQPTSEPITEPVIQPVLEPIPTPESIPEQVLQSEPVANIAKIFEDKSIEEINFTAPSPEYQKLQDYVNNKIEAPLSLENIVEQEQETQFKSPQTDDIILEDTDELKFIEDTPNLPDAQPEVNNTVEEKYLKDINLEDKGGNSIENILESVQNKVNSTDISSAEDDGNLLGAFSENDIPTLVIGQEEIKSENSSEEEQITLSQDNINQPETVEIKKEEPKAAPTEASKPQQNEGQALDFRLFLSGFVVNELVDKFLICAYYIKNILKQENFTIKFINSKLFVATGEIADMSIVEELIIKEYLKQVQTDESVQYTITPEGERYFSMTFQV